MHLMAVALDQHVRNAILVLLNHLRKLKKALHRLPVHRNHTVTDLQSGIIRWLPGRNAQYNGRSCGKPEG